MANTNINLAMEIYSRRFLAAIQPELAALAHFSTDFSDELVEEGGKIRVPIVYADDAAPFDPETNNFERAKADLVDAEVAIDKSAIAGFAITLTQMQNFRPHWWNKRADSNAIAVAAKVQQDVYSLITPENFPQAPINLPLAAVSPKSIATIAGEVAERDINVERAALCLSSRHFYALAGTLDSTVYGGSEVIRRGIIPNLYGFGAVARMPGYEGAGFVAEPSALCIGGRKVLPADTTPYREFSAMVEPKTGIAINRVIYTSGGPGKTSFSVLAWYGRDVGVKEALVILEDTPRPKPQK